MPTYQYACTACGNELEAVQSFSDEPLTECPACAGRLRKVFSTVGVVFKGSGFYRTDSRAGSGSEKKDAPAKETTAAKESSSKESSTKESSSKESSSKASPTAAKSDKAPAAATSKT